MKALKGLFDWENTSWGERIVSSRTLCNRRSEEIDIADAWLKMKLHELRTNPPVNPEDRLRDTLIYAERYQALTAAIYQYHFHVGLMTVLTTIVLNRLIGKHVAKINVIEQQQNHNIALLLKTVAERA